MMYGSNMFGSMGWLSMAVMMSLWIGVLVLVIWGLSGLFPRSRTTSEPDALEIVRQRYARGEISREEYLQATETLRLPDPPVNRHSRA